MRSSGWIKKMERRNYYVASSKQEFYLREAYISLSYHKEYLEICNRTVRSVYKNYSSLYAHDVHYCSTIQRNLKTTKYLKIGTVLTPINKESSLSRLLQLNSVRL